MENLTIDEKNKKRIEKYLHGPWTFTDGYESDIELLEKNNQLTEKFAQKIFEDIIRSCHTTRELLEPKGELKEELLQVYDKFDSIPKPKNGHYYDGVYSNMDFDDVYKNMETCFELLEVEKKHDRIMEARRIAESVIGSVDATKNLEIQLNENVNNDFSKIKNELEIALQSEKTDIRRIQEYIDKYNEHALEIWKEYLTKVEDGKENDFRYLIHNCSKGEIEDDIRTRALSSSLITNKTMGVFGGKSRYGLILKPKHIISADYQDSYTFNEREEGQELFNIKPPIRLPQEIEKICIEQTIEANGEMLNYDKANIYSEIVVDEYEVVGMYYISNGEKELSPNYDRAKRMADASGLKLKELDISKCRQDNGLELMTQESQKEFCRTVLYKYCCQDEKLKKEYFNSGSSFVENNYKDFYDKYVKLKENPEYTSEDILKEFKKTIIDFDVKRWKMYDMYSEGLFIENMKAEDFEYLMDKRYNFDKCTSYKEFEELYTSLCTSLEGRFINEKLEKYIEQRFPNKELMVLCKGNRDILQKLYENKNISINSIEEEIQEALKKPEKVKENTVIVTDPLEEVAQEEKSSLGETQVVEQDLKENENFRINEYGEIARKENEENKIEKERIKTKQEENEKAEKQERKEADSKIYEEKQKELIKPREESFRDKMEDDLPKENASKELQTKKDSIIKMWMNRFGGWYSAIDKVSQNAKAKFVQVKSEIVNAIKDKIQEREDRKEKIEQENRKNEGGR